MPDALSRRVDELGWTDRQVTDADGPALLALVGSVFAEYEGCVLEPDGLDADLHTWQSHLAKQGGDGWVVLAEGDVVACVGVAPAASPPSVDRSSVELKRLYVADAARRRGLGAALVDRVERWARAHDARAVVLWSDTRFHDAHRLYRRLGYRRTGRTRDLNDSSATTEAEFVHLLV